MRDIKPRSHLSRNTHLSRDLRFRKSARVMVFGSVQMTRRLDCQSKFQPEVYVLAFSAF